QGGGVVHLPASRVGVEALQADHPILKAPWNNRTPHVVGHVEVKTVRLTANLAFLPALTAVGQMPPHPTGGQNQVSLDLSTELPIKQGTPLPPAPTVCPEKKQQPSPPPPLPSCYLPGRTL